MTVRNIKAVCSKSNERSFTIQCEMDEYEESNATIQATNAFPGYVCGFIFEKEVINNDEVNAL